MTEVIENPTLSCLIMEENVEVLKEFLRKMSGGEGERGSNVLKVDGVEFQFSNVGLWVRTEIPNEQQDQRKVNQEQIQIEYVNKQDEIDYQYSQFKIRQTQLQGLLLFKDKQVQRLNCLIASYEEKITSAESIVNQLSLKNNKVQQASNLNSVGQKGIVSNKSIQNQLDQDAQEEVEVQYCFDVSVQTQQLIETSALKQLSEKIIVLEQELSLKRLNEDEEEIVIQQEIQVVDIEIQTSITMSEMSLMLSEHDPMESNKSKKSEKEQKEKVKKGSQVSELNSEQRKNFHKRGMLESQKKKNEIKKIESKIIEQKIKVVEKIVEIEVQRIVEKIVHVPVEKIKEVIKQKIVEVPVKEIVERIVELEVEKIVQVPGKQIIKQIPVEIIVEVEKVVERIIEVPVQKQVFVQVIRQVEVQKVVEIQKVVFVDKIVEKQVPVEVEKIVELQKMVLVDKIIEVPVQRIKEVIVEKIVQVEVEKKVNHLVEVPVEIRIIQPQPYPVQTLVIVQVQIQKIIQVLIEKQPTLEQQQNSTHMKFIQFQQPEQKCIQDHQQNQKLLELTSRLSQITLKYQQATVQNSNYKIQTLFYQKQLQKYQILIAQTQQNLQDTKRQSRDLAKQCDSQINQYIHLKDKLQNQIQILKQAKNRMEQNYHLEQQKRSIESISQQKDMDSLLEELNELKEYIDSLKLEIIESEQKMTLVNEQKSKAVYDFQTIEIEYEKLQQEYRILEKDTEGLYTEFKQRQEQIDTIIEQQQMKQSQSKELFEQHMRNLIEKYEELEDKNRFTSLELEKYIHQYNESQNMLSQVSKERDGLEERLNEMEEKIPTDREFGVDQYNELLEALESARNQIMQLKEQVFRLDNFEREIAIGKYDEELSSIKERLKIEANSKQSIVRLLNFTDKCIYDYKKLDSHCQNLRQIVVEYELKNQQQHSSSSPAQQDSQQLKQLLQKVVDQLQKQRYQKDILHQDMEKMIATLYQYQQALIEKQEEINYFRMKMTERNRGKFMMKSSKSNDNLLRSERSNDYSSREYDLSNRDSERKIHNVTAFNRKKLSNEEISVFRNGYENGILNKNRGKKRLNGELRNEGYNTSIQGRMVSQERVERDRQVIRERDGNQVSLKHLMETGYISKLSTLTIMLKLAEKVQQELKNGPLYLTSQSILISNFKQLTPQSIQVELTNTHNPNSLYSSPQLLNGRDYSEPSMVWNLGMIFDQLMHKKLFYSSTKDIINPEDNYMFKSISMADLSKTITKALLKIPEQRISLSNIVFSLSLEIRKIRG